MEKINLDKYLENKLHRANNATVEAERILNLAKDNLGFLTYHLKIKPAMKRAKYNYVRSPAKIISPEGVIYNAPVSKKTEETGLAIKKRIWEDREERKGKYFDKWQLGLVTR